MGTVSQDVLQKHYYCRNNPLSVDMCGGLPQWCPILYRQTRTWTKQGCRKSLCHKHWRKLMGGDCTYQPQRTCNQRFIQGQWDGTRRGYQNRGSCVTHSNRSNKGFTSFTFRATGRMRPMFSGYIVYDYSSYSRIQF